MERLLDIFAKWSPMGQGVFLLVALLLLLIQIDCLAKYFVAFFRGWPPQREEAEDD